MLSSVIVGTMDLLKQMYKWYIQKFKFLPNVSVPLFYISSNKHKKQAKSK